MRFVKVYVFIALACLILAGCGGGASEDKPISEIKTEAESMSAQQLNDMVAKYQKAIESKKAEWEALQEKLKSIPVAQMLGEEAKKLKSDISNITQSVRALTERLNTYKNELMSKQ